MKIRRKIVLITVVTLLCMVMVLYNVSKYTLLLNVQKVEQEHALIQTQRVFKSLEIRLDRLAMIANDWGVWDDMYHYMGSGNPHFIASNMEDTTFINFDVNTILLFDPRSQLIYGKHFDLIESEETLIPDQLIDTLRTMGLIEDAIQRNEGLSGLVSLDQLPVLLAIHPILTSKGQGPPRGIFVVARYVDDSLINRLSAHMDTPITMKLFSDLDEGFQRKLITQPLHPAIIDKNHVQGYRLVRDIENRPLMVLSTQLPRNINDIAQKILQYFILIFILTTLLFVAVFLFLLEKTFVHRLMGITTYIKSLRDLNDPDTSRVGDELSIVTNEINNLVAQLKQSYTTIEENERLYRTLIETSPDGIVLTDLQGRILLANQQGAQLCGYENGDEMVGNHVYQFISAGDWKWATGLKKEVLHRDVIRNIEQVLKRKDGSTFWAQLNVALFRDTHHRPIAFILIIQDISERKKKEEQLKYLSLHDPLTGLYNRTYLERELQKLEGSNNYPITIISIDLDGLKLVNDTLGHHWGDQLLKVSAEVLQKPLRQSDILARMGGDEFIVVLPKTDVEAGSSIIRRIRTTIQQHNRDNSDLHLSMSIGTATAHSSDQPLADIVQETDFLMYEDKFSGGSQSKKSMLKTLRHTLKNQRNTSTIQPIRLKQALRRGKGRKKRAANNRKGSEKEKRV